VKRQVSRWPDVNPQEESGKLSQGLKSCRTVLESYRVMLVAQADGALAEPTPTPTPTPMNDNGG
jgi:hypothetical protein